MINKIESMDIHHAAKKSVSKDTISDDNDQFEFFSDYISTLNKLEQTAYSNNKVNKECSLFTEGKLKDDKECKLFTGGKLKEDKEKKMRKDCHESSIYPFAQINQNQTNESYPNELSSQFEHTDEDAFAYFCPNGDSDFDKSSSLSESLDSIFNEKLDLKLQDLMQLRAQNGLFVEKNAPSGGSPMPFLAPIAFLNVEQFDENSTSDDLSNPFSVESSIKELSSSDSKENTGSGFQNFSQDKQSSAIQEKIMQLPPAFMQTAQQFVQNIKDQFEKFKSNQDKKVTLHLRDGKRNLTMIFDMKGENDIGVLFRTTDMDWKNMLEDNKSAIFEALNDSHYSVDIRYLGE